MKSDDSLFAFPSETTVNLAAARRNAAVFIDNLPVVDFSGVKDRERWASTWVTIADAYNVIADLDIDRALRERALESWLCALTAFEVARRLVDPGDSKNIEISGKVEKCVRKFGRYQFRPAERIRIACGDGVTVGGYFLPADGLDVLAPSVICVSEPDESMDALLCRILPVAAGRGISVLAVAGADVLVNPSLKSEILLGCCVDYLSSRSDVDEEKIAVYGEGLAAIQATDFAASECRVAAVVCDGGIWSSTRTHVAIDWMTGARQRRSNKDASTGRLQLARRIKCPILVIAGERGVVSAPEAVKLHADGKAVGIDINVVIPRAVQTALGAIENFVTVDEFVFGWFAERLKPRWSLQTIKYL